MSREATCAVVGAALGAGTAVALDGEIIGGLVGAGAGAVLGNLVCNKMDMGPGDADNDGVPDDMDKCPNTPAGELVNPDGCSDPDKDGVFNPADRCPTTPFGMKVNKEGCPDPDGDGVYDPNDKCPNTPKGWPVDADGCEKPFVFDSRVHFEHDKARITREAQRVLDNEVLPVLEDSSNSSRTILIEGHTDSSGSDAYNQKLSERRANSVKTYLGTKGVATNRMEATGHGESKPVATNKTREGRAMNRRVEIRPGN
jgi:OOP family OmpA-OmpF porin